MPFSVLNCSFPQNSVLFVNVFFLVFPVSIHYNKRDILPQRCIHAPAPASNTDFPACSGEFFCIHPPFPCRFCSPLQLQKPQQRAVFFYYNVYVKNGPAPEGVGPYPDCSGRVPLGALRMLLRVQITDISWGAGPH